MPDVGTCAGLLDLDDIGTEIRERLRPPRTGEHEGMTERSHVARWLLESVAGSNSQHREHVKRFSLRHGAQGRAACH